MTRSEALDAAVRSVYPFALAAGPLIGAIHKVRRVWFNDDMVLMERPWLVSAIRQEFARITFENECPHTHSLGCQPNLRCADCGEPLGDYWYLARGC